MSLRTLAMLAVLSFLCRPAARAQGGGATVIRSGTSTPATCDQTPGDPRGNLFILTSGDTPGICWCSDHDTWSCLNSAGATFTISHPEVTWPNLKGSLLAAQPYSVSSSPGSSGILPLWLQGTSALPTCSTANADWFLPIGGWIRYITYTISSAMGDGQISNIVPMQNCQFNGLGGSGLHIPPSSPAESYFGPAGTYRIEPYDKVEFNLSHQGTVAAASSITPYGKEGAIGTEFLADQQIAGTGIVNVLGSYFATGQTVTNSAEYAGPWSLSTATSAVEDRYTFPLPVDGTIKYFTASQTSTNAATGTTTITVMKNTVASSVVISVAPVTGATDVNGRAGPHSDETNSFTAVEGDGIDYEMIQSLATTSGSFVNLMLGFIPDNLTTAVVGGSLRAGTFGSGGNTTYYYSPFSEVNETTENPVRYTLPRGGTVSHLHIWHSSASTGSARTVVLTLQRWCRKDLPGTEGSCTIPSTLVDTPVTCTATVVPTATPFGDIDCDPTYTQNEPYGAGDGITLKAVVSGSNGNLALSGWSARFD